MRRWSGVVLAAIAAALSGCEAAERNLDIEVNLDGSGKVAVASLELDRPGDLVFDDEDFGPYLEDPGAAERLGLRGVEEVRRVPIRVEIVSARVRDLNDLRVEDVAVSFSRTEDRVLVSVKFPLGPNALWQKRMPTLAHVLGGERGSILEKEWREWRDWKKRSEQESEPGPRPPDHLLTLGGWVFQLSMPGSIVSASAATEGGDVADSMLLEEDGKKAQLFLSPLAGSGEDAVVTWTVASACE